MEGATHKFVVDLIKEGGDSLTLTVISVPNYRDQDRTENSEDSSGYSNYDYSDRKPLPITVPDYQSVSGGADKFVVRSKIEVNYYLNLCWRKLQKTCLYLLVVFMER